MSYKQLFRVLLERSDGICMLSTLSFIVIFNMCIQSGDLFHFPNGLA